ncbi:unnamed protein product (macronuclear) [Paramecium tetraurelia]|uniref:Uncharacterized protein n=1 Tax=Paramecium tetraurelia TaxID=5888 RepID=A0C198_PARTE|nr:uncharacterized protein GSPATT00034041001 [Paramecium tetraurelia]CAK64565.1 unnamed protein product [Paramecium tetraurelia]|eukprot:XP_001431963.1 hypothetical protein (macronuclear) [Paramecium tetraurelia strain d4-2]
MEEDDKEIKIQYQKIYFDYKTEYQQLKLQVTIIIITSKWKKKLLSFDLFILKDYQPKQIQSRTKTWRRIVLISLIIASKIQDNESFENRQFCQSIPSILTKDINEMERILLILQDYRLQVYPAEQYFILIIYTESKKKNFPLRT